jgi:hypothetical protein
MVPMPFGQRSLAPDSSVARRANFLATDNDLKIAREGIRMTRELFQWKDVRAIWDLATKPGLRVE